MAETAQEHVAGLAVGIAPTTIAFAFYWREASRGLFRLDGRVYVSNRTVHPMWAHREFTLIAAVGAASAAMLAVGWKRQYKDA